MKKAIVRMTGLAGLTVLCLAGVCLPCYGQAGGKQITIHAGVGIRTLKVREIRELRVQLEDLEKSRFDRAQTFGLRYDKAVASLEQASTQLAGSPTDYDAVEASLKDVRDNLTWIRENEVRRSQYAKRWRELGELVLDVCSDQFEVKLNDAALIEFNNQMKKASLEYEKGEIQGALAIFDECEAVLKKCIAGEVSRLLDVTDDLMEAGEWDKALASLQRAGRLAPGHKDIQSRMVTVRKHAVTTLKVVATVEGKEVVADVHVDGEWAKTPFVRDFKKGVKVTLRLSYSSGSSWYGAATAYYDCNWFGEKEYKVELKPVVGPHQRENWKVKVGEGEMEFCFIRAGNFMMGRQRGDQSGDLLHEVELRDNYWLGKTEVTQQEWVALMGRNPSTNQHPQHPIDNVSWDEAMLFCRKLTQQERLAGRLPEGYIYTLPTEAQWEYACRAGNTGAFAFGDDELVLPLYGNIRGVEDAYEKVAPVGKFRANAWGLLDMHGNVSEWCMDLYGTYSGLKEVNPRGPEDAEPLRIHRGGNWEHESALARSYARDFATPGFHDECIGFRVALVKAR